MSGLAHGRGTRADPADPGTSLVALRVTQTRDAMPSGGSGALREPVGMRFTGSNRPARRAGTADTPYVPRSVIGFVVPWSQPDVPSPDSMRHSVRATRALTALG